MYSTRAASESRPLIPPASAGLRTSPAGLRAHPAGLLVPPPSDPGFAAHRCATSAAHYYTVFTRQGLLRLVLFGSPLASFVKMSPQKNSDTPCTPPTPNSSQPSQASATPTSYESMTFPLLDAYLARAAQGQAALTRRDTLVPTANSSCPGQLEWQDAPRIPGQPRPIPPRNEPVVYLPPAAMQDQLEGGNLADTGHSDSDSKSDTEGEEQRNTRGTYSGREYKVLASVAIDVNPWAAGHGQKKARWQQVASEVKAEGCFKDSSMETIKRKMKELMDYQRDPDSRSGSRIARILKGSHAISIASLLDRACHLEDCAKNKTEDERQVARKRDEEDKAGGKAIRDASVRTMGLKREPSTEPDSDQENVEPKSHKRSRKSTKSDSLAELREMREILANSETQQQNFQKDIISAINETTRVYKESQDNLINVLKNLN
ncbi:hypothetical protein LshimejAT787_0211060 [Lyophyllum shimeji]|uniref:Uncharacterized protein n=1 Tax=Lyophyllum shimeji TaxID=47721 RepID=A0A9P3PGR6_LYOSH|nr:hypothetical protein LshimejAT787_0211060 [Lyophyllum shimeji]